ncbi:MAG: YaaA family protein [Campylobacter sputorum]|uniref:YaaA family protein n=1 Tax=Campylobacter sputorum TaxID=206 RepID=UPI002A919B18|nr:YaaA family protein [Campylobacter sputorum]ASM38276.1 DUF328 domain protein [Campylobacter sputorum bv. paraureolyticus LMG 11764]MDY6120949.1 YaaA family protein [Campylobacter sputorum]
MIKILFSPSETKTTLSTQKFISKKSFIFEELFDKRKFVIDKYNNFVNTADNEKLSKIFGLKKFDDINQLKNDIYKQGVIKAVLRYSGVAYDALRYKNLDKKCQKYIDENVFVFSNLFGFIKLGDEIPNYKIKQGEKIGDFRVEKFYNEEFSPSIDKFLENSEIIDLRASFYENFYTIKQPYVTFKFIKNGKVVSHFAKHYRGEVLRQIAIANLQNLNDLGKINFQNLQLIDIKKIKHKEEYLFEIL